MRPVIGLLAVVSLGVACGGGSAPGGPPAPQGLRVHLKFAKTPGPVRYEVHQTSDRVVGIMKYKVARILYVTQVFQDSLDAHLVRVRIDSGRGAPNLPVRLGPYPGFMGWFNDRRDRLDTLATDRTIEMYRADVFDGTIPLPLDSVGVGDVWDAGPTRHVVIHVEDTPIHAAARGVVKKLTVVNGDTIADLGLNFSVKGKFILKNGREIDVHGEEKGDEVFSVNQGIALRVHVEGKIEWDTDVMTPGGLSQVYTILHSTSDRSLIP